MKPGKTVRVALSLVLVLLLPIGAGLAAPKAFPELLPRSSIAYLEVTQPAQILSFVLDGPLWQQLWSYDFVRVAFARDDRMTQLRQVVRVFEAKLGMKWRPMLERLVAGGLGVVVDPSTGGVVVILRSSSKDLPDRLRDAFVELARQDAVSKGRGDPVRVSEYRGVSAYRVGPVHFANLDRGLIITNQGELGKTVIDNHLGQGTMTLAGDEGFQRAAANRSGKRAAWSFLRLDRLRQLGVGPKLQADRSDNPAAELILGGVLSAFAQARYATGELLV
ncbi:MAG: hypothetical protein OER86_11935, partial [Phycisphaerae bacterium]|nr:hypothetical protein [Phycisphaerae bacterium]